MYSLFRKPKAVLLMLVMLLIALSLVGCRIKINSGNKADEDVPGDTEGLIFNSQSNLRLILADSTLPENLSSDLMWALMDNLGTRLKVAHNDSDAPFDHEIVIGESGREISQIALGRLDVLMSEKGNDGFGGYVLYSDGSSLALVYTDEIGTQHIDGIMSQLIEWSSKTSLVKKKGIVAAEVFNMYEIYEKEDEARRDEEFAVLAQKTSPEIAESLRELYETLYTDNIISWLANLYEPRACVCDNYVNGVQVCLHPVDANGNDLCKNGGFYYSNSARNTYGFLPDVESTYQALTFLEMTGMLGAFGGNYGSFVDGQLRADIIAFTKGLQNEDGYFYHPQWTIEESRNNWARVSRDLMWSEAILGKFKVSPYYTTPTGGMSGSGGRPAPVSALTRNLGSSAVSAASVVAAASALPEHLRSVDAFKAYLSKFKMDVFGQGYYAANELAAQVNQLVTADKQLDGALKPILFDFFEEKHNPNNGLWRAETDYDGLNTLFKAIMVYSAFRMPFNYAEQAAESAIAVLSSDEVPGHVCGMYNTWYGISGLIGNIKAHHPSENRVEIGNAIRAKVIQIAPAAIENTLRFTKIFKKSDGSFSYFSDHCSETSQGMVVSLRRNEGDLNASLICTGGMMDHMGAALGVKLPSIFGTRQLAEFCDIIEENGYSVKDSLPPDVIADFENESINAESSSVKSAVSSGGSCLVAEDPLNSDNKVLHFQSLAKSGTWDAVTIPNNTVNVNSNCIVFEGKFMFAKEGTDEGYLVQFYIGSMGDPSPYFINFTIKGNYVEVWESSSDDYTKSFDRLLGKFALDEWFKLRIEYYFGHEDAITGVTPHETVRIKVYTNDDLVAVSANYMDAAMTKFLEGTGTPVNETKQALFFTMSYLKCNVYFDDLYLGYKKIEYKSEKDTKGLIINEDAEDDRKVYTFDEGAEADVTVSGAASKVTFNNGTMCFAEVKDTATVSIPAVHRTALPNAFAFGFDIKADNANLGEVFTIKLKDPYKGYSIVSYTMKCVELDGSLVIAPVYKGSTMLNSAAIPLDGKIHRIEFVFFVGEGTTLIYKDGNMVAATEQGVVSKPFLYEMCRAEISYTGQMTGTLDNIYCERRTGDFNEEVKPKVDRTVYDFADGSTMGLDTNGRVSDGRLSLTDGASVTIPLNARSAYVSAYQFFTNLKLLQNAGKETIYLKYLDSNGVIAIGLVITCENGVMKLYEMINGEKIGEVVGSCEFKGIGTLRLDLYEKERALEVYVNDNLVLVTAVFNGTEYEDISAISISAEVATVDDLYFDGITLTYTAPKVDHTTGDDTSDVITYDYSSLGNYPNRVISGTNITQSSSVEYVERDGELTKAIVYNKVLQNSAGGVKFNFGDGTDRSNLVFETDIKLKGGFASGGWRNTLDLYFSNISGGTHMYILQIEIIGGHIWAGLHDGNSSTKVDCGAIPEDGWFNIRTEVKAGNRTQSPGTGTSFALYINGEEIFTSSVFHGCATSDKTSLGAVYQIQLIPPSSALGTIYLDNTVIKTLQ